MASPTKRVKEVVQRILSRYPALKRNALYYRLQRYRQYRPLRVQPWLTERKDIIEALQRDGVCVLPGYLDRRLCEAMLTEYEPYMKQVVDKTFDGIFNAKPEYGPYRIGEADKYSPTARQHFFADPTILSVAHAFVAPSAVSYRRELDFKVHAALFSQSDIAHFDDWRHRFKAFLYLTDVTELNGPFVYYAKTHHQERWKERYNLEYEIDGQGGRYGHFFPQEMRALVARHGFEERVCTGPAGTLIFADFRGIHRGTVIVEGRRVLLNNTFGIELEGF